MNNDQREAILQLFRNRPTLAPELLKSLLKVDLPHYTHARVLPSELTEIPSVGCRADLVVQLIDREPVLGIVVEVPLSIDPRKPYWWPAYVATLRAQWKCPVHLLVVALDNSVAQWAAQPVPLGEAALVTPLAMQPTHDH